MEFMKLLLQLSLFNIWQFWGFWFYIYFIPCVCFSLKYVVKFLFAKWNTWRTRKSTAAGTKAVEECGLEKLIDEEICMDDLKIVMHRLGIAIEEIDPEEDWDIDVAEIFLEEEPSLTEIKQVFQVFDANGDGFIDATELQRVLRGLCLEEGSNLDECRRMICAFDSNGDGILDFEEFVVVMDKCFS